MRIYSAAPSRSMRKSKTDEAKGSIHKITSIWRSNIWTETIYIKAFCIKSSWPLQCLSVSLVLILLKKELRKSYSRPFHFIIY